MYGVGMFPRVYGGTYPAMMWRAFMGPMLADMPAQGFPAPDALNRGPMSLALDPAQTGAAAPRTQLFTRR